LRRSAEQKLTRTVTEVGALINDYHLLQISSPALDAQRDCRHGADDDTKWRPVPWAADIDPGAYFVDGI
jgi:hypothetical protein